MSRRISKLFVMSLAGLSLEAAADVAIPLFQDKAVSAQPVIADSTQAVFRVEKQYELSELWHTDGTSSGTRSLKLVHSRRWYEYQNSVLYFDTANCGVSRVFANGDIVRLAETCGVDQDSFVEYQGRAYFFRNGGKEVWITDGTVEGTKALASFESPILDFHFDNGYLQFGLKDASGRHTLWAVNAAGERRSLNAGSLFADPNWTPLASVFLSGEFHFVGLDSLSGISTLYRAAPDANNATVVDTLPAQCGADGVFRLITLKERLLVLGRYHIPASPVGPADAGSTLCIATGLPGGIQSLGKFPFPVGTGTPSAWGLVPGLRKNDELFLIHKYETSGYSTNGAVVYRTDGTKEGTVQYGEPVNVPGATSLSFEISEPFPGWLRTFVSSRDVKSLRFFDGAHYADGVPSGVRTWISNPGCCGIRLTATQFTADYLLRAGVDRDNKLGLWQWRPGNPAQRLVMLEGKEISSFSDVLSRNNAVFLSVRDGNSEDAKAYSLWKTEAVTGESARSNARLASNKLTTGIAKLSDRWVSGGRDDDGNVFVVALIPNSVPSIEAVTAVGLAHGAEAEIPLTVSDADDELTQLSFTAQTDTPELIDTDSLRVIGAGARRSLHLKARSNASGAGSVRVSASDGKESSSILLDVTVHNAAPVISRLSDLSLRNGLPSEFLSFDVSDAETSAASLSVRVYSDNETLLPVSRIELGGSGAQRSVRLRPIANQAGVARVTLSVSDGLAENHSSFTVSVAPNQAPTITGIAGQMVTAGQSTAVLPFSIGDAETAPESLMVSVSLSDPSLGEATLSGAGSSRGVLIRSREGKSGSLQVTLKVSDGHAESATAFAVSVQPPASGSGGGGGGSTGLSLLGLLALSRLASIRRGVRTSHEGSVVDPSRPYR